MNLINCLFVWFQSKWIRNVLEYYDLVVTFTFIFFILVPPLPFIFFDELGLKGIVSCLFASSLEVDGIVDFEVGVGDHLMRRVDLFTLDVMVPGILIEPLNFNFSWDLDKMDSDLFDFFVMICEKIVFFLIDLNPIFMEFFFFEINVVA